MIRIEPVNLENIVRQMSLMPQNVERAARSAVRRTLRGGRQDISRKIGQRYTIKVSAVTKTLRITSSGLSGEITSRGGRNPLEKFKTRPKRRPKRPPAGGVFAQVVKGQGGNLPHAFLQRSGGVYERVGKKRFPIRRIKGPSAPGMLGNAVVAPDIQAKLAERLGINFAHEANAFLAGYR